MKKYIFLILIFCLIFSGCKNSEGAQNIKPITVNDIVINKSHAYVDKGDKVVLLAQVFPFNSDNQKINWKSDNSNIAEVYDGIVIGKSEGRTVITATSEDGGFTDKCIVYVSYPKLNYENYQNNLKLEKQNFEINNNSNYNTLNSKNENANSVFDFINNQINSFNEDIKSIKSFFDNIKSNYYKTHDKNSNSEILNNSETTGENYIYTYEYIYNSNGVDIEEDEDTIYKDDNTIIKEKMNVL